MLEREVKQLVDFYNGMNLPEYGDQSSVEEIRNLFKKLSAPNLVPAEDLCETRENLVQTRAGPAKIRGYYPEHKLERAPIIFFRGSGFVVDNLKDSDAFCSKLAKEQETFVLSVGYPLAPEHPFPESIEACYEIYQWIVEHVSFMGHKPSELVLIGESSGGCLAASLTQLIRDRSDENVGYLILFYPVTDYKRDSASFKNHGTGYIMTRNKMSWYLNKYIKKQQAHELYAFPLNAHEYSHLPKTLILAAEYDPLHDQAVKYAEKLKEGNTPCELVSYRGLIHGFMKFNNVAKVKEAHELLRVRLNTFYKST